MRFSTLGVQSYHHDEVITIVRMLSGGFRHMLLRVRESESTPPLYYVVAWIWAKLFGSGEVGLRSLSALLGSATVPVAFLAGREALADRAPSKAVASRAGLIAAALVALNPMLIWYSQEARSYAMLVFFCALSLFFFLRCLRGARGWDLLGWALASAAALWSHYFAGFPISIEAAWLLVALRSRWRLVLPAVGMTALLGLALVPLLLSQISPAKTGWLHSIPFSSRVFQTGVSFLVGETGRLIDEPPHERFALMPAILIGVALVLLAVRGSRRERRGALAPLAVGLGTALVPVLLGLSGQDYVVERNMLPALVPLLVVAAVGFAANRGHPAGSACAAALCVYWLAFAIYVPLTPSLQRLDWRGVAARLGRPHGPRAIVCQKLGVPELVYYLSGREKRVKGGNVFAREIDVVAKPPVKAPAVALPAAFREVEQVRVQQLTLTRYRARLARRVPFHTLDRQRTGFGANAVIVDGAPRTRSRPGLRRPAARSPQRPPKIVRR
ncbi:MAG TPA: glycosyltransferase family 39 protein [Solirubrobacterales bacterium]|nr:glycosyltransferase family 39 protein [Solirubrobacterales bacterium]